MTKLCFTITFTLMTLAAVAASAQQPAPASGPASAPIPAPAPATATGQPPPMEKPALPRGPLLIRMGDMAAWEIAYSYDTDKTAKPGSGETPAAGEGGIPGAPTASGSAAPSSQAPAYPVPNEKLRRTTVTRTKPYWSSVSVDVNGHTYRQWSDGTDLILEPPKKGEFPMLASALDRQSFVDFGHSDFPDMAVVTAANYTGMQAVDAIPCIVFRKGDTTAWIREDNRMPLQWKREGETRRFRSLPRPTAQLTFPASVSKLAEAVRADRQIAAKPIPRGG